MIAICQLNPRGSQQQQATGRSGDQGAGGARPAPEVSTAAEGAVSVDSAKATVTMVAAVTGTRDEVGDVIVPGAFIRTLRERVLTICQAHRWNVPIGRIVSIKEWLSGDPAMMRGGADGRLLVETAAPAERYSRSTYQLQGRHLRVGGPCAVRPRVHL